MSQTVKIDVKNEREGWVDCTAKNKKRMTEIIKENEELKEEISSIKKICQTLMENEYFHCEECDTGCVNSEVSECDTEKCEKYQIGMCSSCYKQHIEDDH